MDSMALGLLSRRESRKDLWARFDDTATILSCANLHSSNAARPLKTLEDAKDASLQ